MTWPLFMTKQWVVWELLGQAQVEKSGSVAICHMGGAQVGSGPVSVAPAFLMLGSRAHLLKPDSGHMHV